MKKLRLRFLAAAAALVAVLPCAVSPVFANSGIRYEYGITGTGVVVKNEQSVLAVENENLTFNIVDYPEYPNIDGYKSTVTAEYTFVNTSDNTVNTSMAFPIGTDPACEGVVADPIITLNGDIIPVQTRHTYGYYQGYGDFSEIVNYLSDDFYEDDFYKPDMPVTRYTVSVDTTKDTDVRCVGKYACDAKRARVIGLAGDGEIIEWVNGKDAEKADKEWSERVNSPKGDPTPFPLDFSDLYDRSFYVIGDTSAFSCDWHAEKFVPGFRFTSCYSYTSGSYRKTNVGVTVTETGRTTLKQLLLSRRKPDSVVNEIDWYNAMMSRFYTYSGNAYAAHPSNLSSSDDQFTAWYTYDVEVEPHGKVINTVTAPIFPSLRYGYDPYKYDYEYYLSPAKSWKSFGTLNVTVKTDNFMVEPPEGFEKCEGGYRATFDGLPEGELYFGLCSVEEPKYVGNRGGISWAVVIIVILRYFCASAVGGIIVVIYCIVRLFKNRKKNS